MKKFLYPLLAVAFISCNFDEPDYPGGEWSWTNPYLEPMSKIQMTDDEFEANRQINNFSFELMRTISQNYEDVYGGMEKDNMSISPISAAMCLAMVANTCDDATNECISRVLGYDDVETLSQMCNKLLRYLPCKENQVQLSLANSVWYERSKTINNSYIEQMNSIFGAFVGEFEYGNEDEALDNINGWCNYNTNGMIPEILKEINPELCMILINALYFNGAWSIEFDKDKTKDAPFYGTLGTTSVKMMEVEIKTSYGIEKDFASIYIPFKKNYALRMVLPEEGKNIVELQNELTYERWRNLNHSLVEAKIRMPRFSINQGVNLSDVLSIMGVPMRDIYLDKAGIPDKMNMQVHQKTSTTVNEEGAKAAAVTVTESFTSPNPFPEYGKIEITFDRPFIFFIENEFTGSIIMAGRICNL